MATGRTHPKFQRVYIDGYDMSGYSRSLGEGGCTFDEGIDDALSRDIKAVIAGQGNASFGPLNGIFDNTADSGLHVVANAGGTPRDVLVGIGIQAVPADNDPSFSGRFEHLTYSGNPDSNPVAANLSFGAPAFDAANLVYANPFGVLLHANAAETDANSATGLDQAAQSTLGGWMMYQVLAGDGNAAIKVQDADTNLDGSFGDLLTSGNIDCSTPTSGIVALDMGSTVERYVRWQLTLDTATTVTFVLSWHRNLVR